MFGYSKNMMTTGLWILIFGLTGTAVAVFLATLALFVKRIKSLPTVQDGIHLKCFVNFYGPESSISFFI